MWPCGGHPWPQACVRGGATTYLLLLFRPHLLQCNEGTDSTISTVDCWSPLIMCPSCMAADFGCGNSARLSATKPRPPPLRRGVVQHVVSHRICVSSRGCHRRAGLLCMEGAAVATEADGCPWGREHRPSACSATMTSVRRCCVCYPKGPSWALGGLTTSSVCAGRRAAARWPFGSLEPQVG